MADEDEKYDDFIRAANALAATNRKEQVRTWFVDFAVQIFEKYGSEEKKNG